MKSSMFSLEGKVAIITGSAHGIGKGIALGFAALGAKVVAAGINIYDPSQTVADLNAVSAQIEKQGGEAFIIPTDVRDSDQVDNMVHKTLDKFGHIDVLVNNVGGVLDTKSDSTYRLPFLEVNEKAWDEIITENLKTTFLCSKAVAKVMVDQGRGGSIINIASTEGINPSPELAHYGAAKSGVINLAKSLAVELAPHNIRVNSIAPGLIDHEITRGRRGKKESSWINLIPLGRSGQPKDIAAAAIYLASDAADYVTGITILVDGGALLGRN
ncbi:SDR family NAD(P)-dependent oxidoreductase [Chloroflexota bacterium]